jgi:hypothetical protein
MAVVGSLALSLVGGAATAVPSPYVYCGRLVVSCRVVSCLVVSYPILSSQAAST